MNPAPAVSKNAAKEIKKRISLAWEAHAQGFQENFAWKLSSQKIGPAKTATQSSKSRKACFVIGNAASKLSRAGK